MAQGRPGARRTHGPLCQEKCTGVVTTGSAETVRPSLRNGFTAYSALSPATNSSCRRRPQISGGSNPVESDLASADLTPATGARTTRLHRTRPVLAKRLRRVWYPSAEALVKTEAAPFVCAPADSRDRRRSALSSPLRARRCRVHRIPTPTSVTIAIRPSCGPERDQ